MRERDSLRGEVEGLGYSVGRKERVDAGKVEQVMEKWTWSSCDGTVALANKHS
jgi:hypothetical protein